MGVPVIAQVDWFRLKPAGKGGFDVHDVGVPPPPAKVGVILAFTTFEIIYGEVGYVISAGFKTGQSTCISTVPVLVPRELTAVTV